MVIINYNYVNYMKYSQVYKKLAADQFYLFSFGELKKFFPRESPAQLKLQIHQWKHQGWLKVLRRGVYQLAWPEEKVLPDFYLANRLYQPSYVSLETALSYYSLIPEVAMAVTSLTTRTTRKFKTPAGLFIYRTIKGPAFIGYRLIKEGGFEIRLAEPEKALADYLYYQPGKLDSASLRLDNQGLKKLNRRKLDAYAGLLSQKVKNQLEEIYAEL